MRLAVLFVAWAGLTVLWSPDQMAGLVYYSRWLMLLAVFWAARKTPHIPLMACAAIAVEIALSVYDPRIYGGLGNENFQAEFLVIAASITAWGAWNYTNNRHSEICLVATIAALVQVVAFNASNAKWAALAAFLIALALLKGRREIVAVFVVAAGGAMLLLPEFASSGLDRFEFAFNTLVAWTDYPLVGYGLGGFDYVYPYYAERHLPYTGQSVMDGLHWYAGAAHNEFIQLAAETGLVGVLLLGAALARNVRDWLAVSPLIGLCLVGFPLQNPSTALAATVLLACSARRSP